MECNVHSQVCVKPGIDPANYNTKAKLTQTLYMQYRGYSKNLGLLKYLEN